VVETLPLAPGVPAARPLPGSSWDVSFDARLAPGGVVQAAFGYGSGPIDLRRSAHVEATSTELEIGPQRIPVEASRATTLTFRLLRGRAHVGALIISRAGDRGALLLHRVAELHARIPLGQFPIGADRADRVHYRTTYWTSGFWPGALWQAATLGGDPLGGWALSATLAHFGQERSDTHDVGFMYSESSLAAWNAVCSPRRTASAGVCAALRRSVLSAADELVALADSNRAAGTIPTTSGGTQANTIVDSMMNIAILPWASRVTGNPVYAAVAARHAHRVASLLVRGDGSTIQSVNFDRATGQVLFFSTHQGISESSTWSRGQGWAVYGFAQAAADLHDAALLRMALRTAGYVASHLPEGGVSRWDYDAPPGAPLDVSAGAITAAGLMHLSAACRTIPHVCVDQIRWVTLARRMLAATLRHASAQPPLGFLGQQALNEHGRGCWCNGGELIFGVTYALEAEHLLR
jgi:unsaturated chondroitin disaccharide hydrolase